VLRADPEGHLELIWDASDRLVESRTNGVRTEYGYDGLGRRLFKQTADVRTPFLWDGDSLVLEKVVHRDPVAAEELESAEMTEAIREYVYYPGTFEPLARIDAFPGGHEVLYFHNDPNGCPTRMTDRSGNVKWRTRYGAWGQAVETREDAVENPLRLVGQYEDHETGLVYNRFRYFDPAVGQFASQDPIGLVAGENLYAYGRNVWGWVDPLGLKCNKKLSFKAWLKQKAKAGNTTHVYIGYKDGKPIYVGISVDVNARAVQHGTDKFDELVPLTTHPLNRGEARSIEQAIIANNPHFMNEINSISPTRALYGDAVAHGEKWLTDNGFGTIFK
jgi:RHS repeat-associated protein